MTPPRTRSTAEQRRVELVAAASAQFAASGLHGTSTEAIARRAGISHAYLFRLFGTKKQLFIACAESCFARIAALFEASAAGDTPADRLHAMGRAYEQLLSDRELLLGQMQLYAACDDPEIRAVARSGFERLRSIVSELSGASGPELHAFFAYGMLLNVAASIDFPALGDPERW